MESGAGSRDGVTRRERKDGGTGQAVSWQIRRVAADGAGEEQLEGEQTERGFDSRFET